MFIKVLNLSINASWLILAILVLRPLLRKAPKWIRCTMWAIVALRLLLPFSIESALSVLPGSEVIPQDIVTTKTPAIHSQIMAVDNAVNPFMLRELAPKVENSVNPMQVIAAVACVVWIIGVVVCLTYALISYLLLKRKVSASVEMGDGIMACDEIKTPFILGIIKPMIYVPSSMTGRTLEVVLAHEQAHMKRMDHLWKPLGFLLFFRLLV
jgi:beta-lactamase regulating signal transducer with metallopeptidase domain